MDPSVFQKELGKYRIIRQADYCKSKLKSKSRISTTDTSHSSKEIVKIAVPVIQSNNDDFWELLSSTNCSVLSPAESIKLIGEVKAEHESVQRKFSLFDLDTIAASILAEDNDSL